VFVNWLLMDSELSSLGESCKEVSLKRVFAWLGWLLENN
jgi:hypothetical protein